MPIGTVAQIKAKEVETAFPNLKVAGLPYVSHNEVIIKIYDISPNTVQQIKQYINNNGVDTGYDIYFESVLSDAFERIMNDECERQGIKYYMNGNERSYMYFDRTRVIDELLNVLDAANNVFSVDSINPIAFLKQHQNAMV